MPQPVSAILERLRREPIIRTFAVDRATANEDKRTVQIAFASDKPIEHWFGLIALTMSKKAMRADRLRNGAPLLMDHNTRDQVGVIESHALGTDGIARATVRFGESTRASEVFRDVQTGIRRNISVGFMVYELEFVKQEKGKPDLYRCDDWEPYEISIVSVPADISVGVGRSQSFGVRKKMENENGAENSAAEEIIGFASIFGEEQLARQMILASSSVTVDDVRVAIRAKQPRSIVVPPMPAIEQAARSGAGVQLARSIPRYGKLKAFEGDGAEERAYAFGQWILGGPLGNASARQWCAERGLVAQRSQVEGINSKGGFLVPEEFGNDFVQLLEKYGVFRRNAHIVPMSSDHRTDYVLNGELDSQFVGELVEGSDQDLDFGSIGYTARKHMILVPYSSEVSEDAATSIGDQLAEAAARAFAKKEDRCGFLGDATSTYGGMVGIIVNLLAVHASPSSIPGLQVAAGNTYAEILLTDFAKTVKRLPSYARPNAKWYMTDDFYWGTVVPLLLASGGTTMGEIEATRGERLFGKPIEFVEVMPTTEANSQICSLFGDLSMGARLGDRRAYTYKVDESILIRKDGILFQATARFDVNSAFGVGDTTVAGPIVGLVTAAS